MNSFAICLGTIAPLFDPCVVIDPISAIAFYYVGAIALACVVATALFRRFG